MNLFGMGPLEILLIVVLALIVFGPARLPEIMGQVGKAIADFRRVTSELSDEFNKTIQSELKETRAVVDDAKSTVTDLHSTVTDLHASVNSAVTGIPAPVRTSVPGAVEVEALPAAASNGTNTNGAASVVTPPAAETVAWSWETSASPAKTTASPALPEAGPVPVETSLDEPTVIVPSPQSPTIDASQPAPPASSPSPERTLRDEQLPPY